MSEQVKNSINCRNGAHSNGADATTIKNGQTNGDSNNGDACPGHSPTDVAENGNGTKYVGVEMNFHYCIELSIEFSC